MRGAILASRAPLSHRATEPRRRREGEIEGWRDREKERQRVGSAFSLRLSVSPSLCLSPPLSDSVSAVSLWLYAQRLFHQPRLLELVNCVRPGPRACARRAPDVAQFHAPVDQSLQARSHEIPSAHVLRLLLRPDDLFGLRVGGHPLLQQRSREWVELFETQDGDASIAALLVFGHQVVIDLAAANDHSLDAARIARVADDRIEASLGELI